MTYSSFSRWRNAGRIDQHSSPAITVAVNGTALLVSRIATLFLQADNVDCGVSVLTWR
jgi:hypothetical protein